MSDENLCGVAPYGGGAPSRAANVMALMRRKAILRAELEMISAQISEAVPALNAIEVAELQSMLAGEIDDCGTDAELLSQQVEREAALAASTKAMEIRLDRTASQALQQEMLRQIEHRGCCLAPAQLAAEAIRMVFK